MDRVSAEDRLMLLPDATAAARSQHWRTAPLRLGRLESEPSTSLPQVAAGTPAGRRAAGT